MKHTHFLVVISVCYVALRHAWAVEVAVKGVFESCPACKLNAMPELKRFLHESVLKGAYGDKLTVNFVPGATPKLILYGADGKELSREEVSDALSFAELHTWVQGKGFSKVPTVPTAEAAGADSDASTMEASGASRAAAATRLRQRQRGQADGHIQRRRLAPAARRQAAADALAAEGVGDELAGHKRIMRRRRYRRAGGRGGGLNRNRGDMSAVAAGEGGGRVRRMRRRRALVRGGPAAEA